LPQSHTNPPHQPLQHADAGPVQRVSSIRCIGLCDQPYVLKNAVARLVNALPEEVRLDYFGINHLAWAKGFWQQEKDITDAVLTRANSLGPKYLPPR
jgi:6-phospho-beta-glucosidase